MTEQVAEEIPTTVSGTVSDMVSKLRDAAPEIDLEAGRRALTKKAKAARKSAKKTKATITGKHSLRERVFGWPLYSVAAAGAAIGTLAWWRGRQHPVAESAPAPSEVSVVDPADVEATKRQSTG